MHSEKSLGVLSAGLQQTDGKRRGIAADRDLRAENGFEFVEDLQFDRKILQHALDDEFAGCEILERLRLLISTYPRRCIAIGRLVRRVLDVFANSSKRAGVGRESDYLMSIDQQTGGDSTAEKPEPCNPDRHAMKRNE